MGPQTGDLIHHLFHATAPDSFAAPFCALSYGLEGRRLAIGLTREGDSQWRYTLPSGSFESPVRFVTSAPLLDPDDAHGVEDRFRRDVAALSESHLPALEGAAVVNEWVGLRTVTPDFRPVVGPTARDGFLVACGMSGSGVGLAPLVGRLVADHVDGDGDGPLLRQLSARRFGSGTAPS